MKRTEMKLKYSCLDMVHEKDIYPPLLDLIKEADGEMLFVEKDDDRFTMKEYEKMCDEIVKKHPSLGVVVDVNLSDDADYRVCIYMDALKLIYNDSCLEKALPRSWEPEANIWMFLQDHQGKKWEKLLRNLPCVNRLLGQRTIDFTNGRVTLDYTK